MHVYDFQAQQRHCKEALGEYKTGAVEWHRLVASLAAAVGAIGPGASILVTTKGKKTPQTRVLRKLASPY